MMREDKTHAGERRKRTETAKRDLGKGYRHADAFQRDVGEVTAARSVIFRCSPWRSRSFAYEGRGEGGALWLLDACSGSNSSLRRVWTLCRKIAGPWCLPPNVTWRGRIQRSPGKVMHRAETHGDRERAHPNRLILQPFSVLDKQGEVC